MGNRPVDDLTSDRKVERPQGRAGTDVPTVVVTRKSTPQRALSPEPKLEASKASPKTSGTSERASAKPASAKPGTNASGATASGAMPRAAGNRLPSPTRPPRPQAVVAPAVHRPPVSGPTQTTAIAAPPPPPITIAASTTRKADQEATEIVAPLPPPGAPASKDAPERPASPRVIVDPAVGAEAGDADREPAGRARVARIRAAAVALARRVRLRTAVIGAAVVAAAILVVTIGFSSDGVSGAARNREVAGSAPSQQPQAAPAPDEPVAAAPGPSSAPASAQPIAAPPPPATAAAAPAAEVAMQTTDAPAAVTGEPPGASTPHTARPHVRSRSASPAAAGTAIRDAGRPAKPAGQPRKPARPLTYDPDALFLKKP